MTITTLVTFIRLTNANGEVEDGFLYQNGKRDDVSKSLITDSRDINTVDYVKDDENAILYQSNNAKAETPPVPAENYYYLPFLYQGASKNRSGDNLEAALVLANNILAMNRAREVVTNKWHVEVSVCVVNPETMVPTRTLTSDTWLAASLSYDSEVIEVLLSSAIDAVGSNAPNRVLTSAVVGALPTSSQIQNI